MAIQQDFTAGVWNRRPVVDTLGETNQQTNYKIMKNEAATAAAAQAVAAASAASAAATAVTATAAAATKYEGSGIT